uniref:glycerophosphocholine cholinephosphodiesterase n=1 Tax=Romanomermis culicivorax TaxID=13658 RepID=A0A915IQU6_ROMCU
MQFKPYFHGQGVDKHQQILNEIDFNQTLLYNGGEQTKSILLAAREQGVSTSIFQLTQDSISNISINVNQKQLIVFYSETLYSQALIQGSQSYDVEKQVEVLSKMIENLQNRITKSNLLKTLDLIVLSTHGLPQESIQWIYLDDFINMHNIAFVVSLGAFTMIYPAQHKTNQVYRELLENVPNVKVYLREDIPDRLKLKNSIKFAPILVIAENPFSIFCRNLEKIVFPKFAINNQLSSSSAEELFLPQTQSGYDNLDKDMRGVFFARGPC